MTRGGTEPRTEEPLRSREGQQESQECPSSINRFLKAKAYHLIADEVMGGPQDSLLYQP